MKRDVLFARSMNSQILEEASKVVTDIPVLINIISKRVRQLNAGSRPMVEVHLRMGLADIALAEVAAGKLKATEGTPDVQAVI